jgi:hypothetical protein
VRPSVGIVMVFTSQRGTVTSTKTGSDGRYTIELPAGDYKVSGQNYMRMISGPPIITVRAGSTVVADYVFDSGIRTGVPQK